MSAQRIPDDVVREVARDLRARYAFDDEDVRLLGAKLADDPAPGECACSRTGACAWLPARRRA